MTMAADILLLIFSIVLLLAGFVGSVMPFPGPPLSYIGLLLLHWSRFADFSSRLLWTLGLLTVLVTALDLLVPMWGVKRLGGSKYGMWGSAIGLFIGLFAGPWGIFIGAFLGGFVGELIAGRDSDTAFRAATGSFFGFVLGALMKMVLCVVMIWYAVVQMMQ
jgi:uncharacterized protein YqgC (DUF456 family)